MNGRTPLDSEEVLSVKKMVAGFASSVLKLTELCHIEGIIACGVRTRMEFGGKGKETYINKIFHS